MTVEIKKDGRTILKGQDYTDFRKDLYDSQQGQCIKCGKQTSLVVPLEWGNSFHAAHRGSRGMGSAIRDDVVGPKRGQVEGGKCGSCHRNEHNQEFSYERSTA
jgi:hypothetical protein